MSDANGVTARRPLRILLVEDYVPDATLGSGYGRMIDTITELQRAGDVTVTLFPTFGASDATPHAGPKNVEILDIPLERHLAEVHAAGGGYDLVIVSRPHNYEVASPILSDCLPGVPVIYDAEALYFRRLERQAKLATGVVRAKLLLEAAAMRRLEERIAAEADAVVCISDEEADLLTRHARRRVEVNGPLLAHAAWTDEGFSERRAVGFVAGWSAGPRSPNVDGLKWFARHVWPRVLARVPGAELVVTGSDPPLEVTRFECSSIHYAGVVPDLNRFYASLRLAVVPIRYGSGVKLKAVEALQSGVPTVATAVGAEGIPTDVTDLIPVTDDAREFADLVALLIGNEEIWRAQRERLKEQCRIWEEHPQSSVWPGLVAHLVGASGRGGFHV
ncbi:MAG TPA: glycosyltransferase family 4 protein [Acidimicrobiales bacterium]|nr:glycosyltransferase family 4 protein [Acidimicrobiales bacterium]